MSEDSPLFFLELPQASVMPRPEDPMPSCFRGFVEIALYIFVVEKICTRSSGIYTEINPIMCMHINSLIVFALAGDLGFM